MAFPPPVPAGNAARQAGGGAVRTADGRPMELVMLEDSGRDLRQVLKPGSSVSGRVVERFENGSYLFTLRGRNLIAESAVPLLRDSVVRFAVLDAGSGRISLRLLDAPTSRDQAVTSDLASRLQALRLPDSPAVRSAIQAFEDAGVPLDRVRIERAAAQLASTPPARQATVVAAHAQLARAGLPITPATLALAEQALRPGLPALAAQLRPAATALAQVPLPVPAPGASANAAAQNASAPRAPVANAPTAPAAAVAANPPSTTPGAAAASAAMPANPPLAPGAPLPFGAPTPGAPATGSGWPTAGGELAALIPDPGSGGREAAAQALALAGLRGAATPDQPPPGASHERASIAPAGDELRALVQQLAALTRALEAQPGIPREAIDGLHQSLREGVAERLMPPATLDDYDLVLPMPLQNQGQAVPARVAVSNRHGGSGGDASFVRIDLELEWLGPLSIRLSAHQAGPLAIVLLATGHAIRALEAERAALEADLQELGIESAVRVDDLVVSGAPR